MKKGKGKNNDLLQSSLRIISSCLKTVSTNTCTVASTIRSAGASVASSIASPSDGHKDQPFPVGVGSGGQEWLRKSHPLLLVVAGAGDDGCVGQNGSNLGRDGNKVETQYGNADNFATAVSYSSSAPVPSHSGLKASMATGNDADNAGMLGIFIMAQLVYRAIISQFKAHSSPISTLCFDPSGTLMVTASVYGNNVNIFRIMPSCARKGSGVSSCDWSATHAHLYRLHRGITPAVSIS
ncbi:hypothetical protein TSUD_39130 [Trifolium subterraneum]|uniref:BCAS3 WD40 domain-containing protein n=1 Tax=Trifolium subterraneum TaxID=3900 RepID=A0A2Z6NG49_TRISU|nr:hypothetical protein TSUD_39130 [Trifolium subterraneum]